ncbi:gap junction alpha-9 protein [Erinaceus europaeus]|uniref:Gap junction protein n=1 Tax=Erinaceus europaeus TaxID=9365 RepID=A0A1S2ZZV5_ERIEU|nr:gap junction alpha-9 protein [Erinaceus europaeus]
MGDWKFLGGFLEEVHVHSTMIGKIWLTILFIFRMLVLGVAAEDVWKDEQSGFICNTEQPGCRNVCYDQAFPISLIRYWVLQVVFVSSPSLVYMGHALYQLKVLEKERKRKKAQLRGELERVEFEMPGKWRRLGQELCQLEQRKLNKAPLRGTLLCTYVIHIFTRSVVEVGFMAGQYLLYGFCLQPLFKCHGHPCPNTIDCFVSRPTEKTIFLFFMQSIATISLCLNVLEIFHLGLKKIKRGLCRQYNLKNENSEFYMNKSKQNLAKYQSTAADSLRRLSSAPDYNLLVEKHTHNTVCTSSNSLAFQTDPDHHSGEDENCIMNKQDTISSNEMCILSSTCNSLHEGGSGNKEYTPKIFGKEVKDNQLRECDGNNRKSNHYSKSHCSVASEVITDLDLHKGQSPQTTFSLPDYDICKPKWLQPTRGLSIGDKELASPPKGHLSDQFREGIVRTSPPSKGGFQPSDIPDSLQELSFESELVRICKNPIACLPNHLVLLTNNHIDRRAPTDLQI